MKSRFADNLITLIILILIIIIFSATVFFCVDVFGIVDVPEKYSIASLFYKKIDVMVEGQDLTTDIIDDKVKNKVITSNVVETNETEETSSVSMDDLVDKLNNAQTSNSENEITQSQSTYVSVKYFYYDQLDSYGKIIYDGLYSHIEDLKDGTYTADFGLQFNDLLHEEYGSEVLNNSFQLAINALTFDNPELFYLDVTKMYLLTSITTKAFSKTYEVKVGGNEGQNYLSEEFNSSDKVNNYSKIISDLRDDLASEADKEEKIEDKIKVVHDYLVDTIEYDASAGDNIYNVYGALINKKAVCEGYARSFKYVMDKLNIPCLIACGIGTNSSGVSESHAWNYVKIQGIWYAIDVTWDDPVIIGNGKISNDIKYAYFLKGSDKFFRDHLEDGNIVGDSEFKYPELSTVDY